MVAGTIHWSDIDANSIPSYVRVHAHVYCMSAHRPLGFADTTLFNYLIKHIRPGSRRILERKELLSPAAIIQTVVERFRFDIRYMTWTALLFRGYFLCRGPELTFM